MDPASESADLARDSSGEASGPLILEVGDSARAMSDLQRNLCRLRVQKVVPQIPQVDTSACDLEVEEEDELNDDFVPLHLVSVSSHSRHHAGYGGGRRRSDPGRILLAARSSFGSSDSSEDDDMPTERSSRSRSPRRRRRHSEDECYPSSSPVTGFCTLDRNIATSPRRRLSRSTSNELRRARAMRSNSLPDAAILGVPFGEAIGAVCRQASSDRFSAEVTSLHPRQAAHAHLGMNGRRGSRCFSSIEEPNLESIIEDEMGTQKQKQLSYRRSSVPSLMNQRLCKKLTP